MFETIVKGTIRHTLLLAGLVLGSASLAPHAFAGECPADKQGVDVREPVSHAAKGKTDTTIASIDLSKQPPNIDHTLRMRIVTVEPGGIVPWHSHANRPALIYVIQGEIEEYASTCSVPIVHKAGEVSAETADKSHWWQNHGDETVILLAADLVK